MTPISMLDRIHGCLLGIAAGDCDTLGAITGGLVGTLHGVNGFPPLYDEKIEAVNSFGLRQLATRYLETIQQMEASPS